MLTEIIVNANRQGRWALIPFLTAGFPTKQSFWKRMEELDEGGADIIEIGVPFSDPVADGPQVAAAGQKVLDEGLTFKWILEGLAENRRKIKAGIVLMGYANVFLSHAIKEYKVGQLAALMKDSLDQLAAELSGLGVNGVIIPDLQLGEDEPWLSSFSAKGLDLIPLVGPNTTTERLTLYASRYQGYVYVVSVMGTTGVREGLGPEATETLKKARSAFSLPLALGFGLKHPSQLKEVEGKSYAPDALIFGSALLNHLEKGLPVNDFMKVWRS